MRPSIKLLLCTAVLLLLASCATNKNLFVLMPDPADTFILYFKKGSTDLADESLGLFPTILAAIKANKSTDISVVGHSDTVGARQKNYELSFDRARRLKEIIVSKGVDTRFVETDSHGEDNLLVKTADEVAEPRNRRVEVTVR
jgi:outer membrane protein OmpA-like peptidoglycan-associated protein